LSAPLEDVSIIVVLSAVDGLISFSWALSVVVLSLLMLYWSILLLIRLRLLLSFEILFLSLLIGEKIDFDN